MKGTFEVKATKGSQKTVRYYTVRLYNGIANELYDRMKKLGYKDINIRLM